MSNDWSRRGFLGTMLAGLGALTIPHSDALLWAPDSEAAAVVAPDSLITLKQVTRAMLDRIIEKTQANVRTTLDYKIGQDGVISQYAVFTGLPFTIGPEGVDRERYIYPMADALAEKVGRHVKACGVLPVYLPGVKAVSLIDVATGMSLRGIQMYDIQLDIWRTRFDIAVG